jgi:hypothetical protein
MKLFHTWWFRVVCTARRYPVKPSSFLIAFIFILFFVNTTTGVMAQTSPPPIDYDKLLKPLVDTSRQSGLQDAPTNAAAPSLYGQARQTQDNTPSPEHPLVLNAKVQTLQQAIESERFLVDWYAWYLSLREYLSRSGGLHCPLGTPIKFYRNGRMEAMSDEPRCRISVATRSFLLPPQTRLDAILLPVRRGTAPPASRNELYTRIHEQGE